jgi:hypothetical protein
MDMILGLFFAAIGWLFVFLSGAVDELSKNPWVLVIFAGWYGVHLLEKGFNRRFDDLQRQISALSERLTGRNTYSH